MPDSHSVRSTPEAPPQLRAPSRGGLGSAHGKAILMGEHSVVYGAPAIALPLLDLQTTASVREAGHGSISSDLYTGPLEAAPAKLRPVITALRATADRVGLSADTFEIVISSTIPLERGLGSSAAVAAAMVRAVSTAAGIALSPDETFELVQIAEHVAHGTSSGLDAHAVRSLAPVRFQAGVPTPVRVAAPMTLVVADSGTSGSTSAAVGGVRMLKEARPSLVESIVDSLASLSDIAIDALGEGDAARLGATMFSGHEQLARLGVSAPALDALVAAAADSGAHGAKLTGSGLGGCVLALVEPDAADSISAAMEAAGAVQILRTTLPGGQKENE
ncbi:mevalonate kinase [Flaviflexus huanghaiensis]|uniref:mevalonate kinase n=1 Tax=Flaviflexus huanghaiensis TaxID=1111473 RepID=UPI001F51462C|nr:mevalonate kinase [Flaviflexus huanghaiensis]